MKTSLLILLSIFALSLSVKTKWWGYPWGYYGFYPYYYEGFYAYPYFFYFKNVNDAPKEAPLMYKLPEDTSDNCTDETKATVCGFDEDKKIVGEYENICDASNDNEVAFIVCGKCPDKDSEERVFDIPLTENMPTCPKDTI